MSQIGSERVLGSRVKVLGSRFTLHPTSYTLHPERGFTLIEVLIAVAILSIGMIGVIRAYAVMMNGIEASRFTVEASYLLKDRMADIEEAVIENYGIPYGTRSGRFEGDFAKFGWEEEIDEIRIEREASAEEAKIGVNKGKEGERGENRGKEGETGEEEDKEGKIGEEKVEILNKVRISVSSSEVSGPARRLNLYTYLEGHPQ